MQTKLVRVSETEVASDPEQRKAIEKAGQILREGGLVAFPTETVYGLGGDALNRESSRKIYAAKGRPSDNPLIVHIACLEALYPIVEEVPESALRLAKAFWPGPLTMILKKSGLVPFETTGGLDTVAVRMPSDAIARAMIEAGGGYVAAPSANTSGKPSPTQAKYVAEDMDGKIDMILDGGAVCIGLESTIVDLTEERPMILRPGYITKDMLEKVLGEVEVDRTILSADSGLKPKAPGMKYRHYAPKGELTIVSGEEDAVVDTINRLSKENTVRGEKVGIIATQETRERYAAAVVKCAGRRADEEAIARSLYTILREFDDEDVTVMYSESFEGSEMGQAIMNRLLKAAGHHVIETHKSKEKEER
ncbi:MAG: threonylcarbamoyl-AMP synthase [Lachnospiraceae bacterium]|nr:threonylcarbamoyl-AMP synthase [Lachnospiraceae bacterium]